LLVPLERLCEAHTPILEKFVCDDADAAKCGEFGGGRGDGGGGGGRVREALFRFADARMAAVGCVLRLCLVSSYGGGGCVLMLCLVSSIMLVV
jgi:hypothetical protein